MSSQIKVLKKTTDGAGALCSPSVGCNCPAKALKGLDQVHRTLFNCIYRGELTMSHRDGLAICVFWRITERPVNHKGKEGGLERNIEPWKIMRPGARNYELTEARTSTEQVVTV